MRNKAAKLMTTVVDIARETGFSTITVSRAINSPDKVKPHTLEIINQKIKELNYVPNVIAKALVTKRSNIILLYIPNDLKLTHPFTMNVVAGISEVLGPAGYSLRISRERYQNELCDGIIIIGIDFEDIDYVRGLARQKQIIIFGTDSGSGIDWIDIDNFHGSMMMTDYMFDRGYKNMGYIGICQHRQFADERTKGYFQSLKRHGIKPESANIETVPNDEQSGYRAANRLLENSPQIDALICASDLLALGAMRAIKERGLNVPEDIAVTGFDGLGYEAFSHPHLTTVRQPIFEIGRLLAENLIRRINGTEVKTVEMLIKPELLNNSSTR